MIFSEQGIGDLFQFSRYLFKLKEQFECKVILRLKHNLSLIFDKKKIHIVTEKDRNKWTHSKTKENKCKTKKI